MVGFWVRGGDEGVWSVVVSLLSTQVLLDDVSITEDVAALAHVGNGTSLTVSTLADSVTSRIAIQWVACTWPVECRARVPGLRHAGFCLHPALERHSNVQGLSFPSQGEALWARLRQNLEVPLPPDLALQRGLRSFWRSYIVRAFVQEANDPEQHPTDWVLDGAQAHFRVRHFPCHVCERLY